MGRRDYPPAPQIHRPDCPSITPGAFPVLDTPEIARRYPNGVLRNCCTFHANSTGVVEPVVYPAHERSTLNPPDARVPWCRTCRGTHGGEAPAAHGLLVARRNQRILLPGEAVSGSAGVVLPGGR